MNVRFVRFVLILALLASIILPSSKANAEAKPNVDSQNGETWIAPDGQKFFMETFSSEESLSKQNVLIQPLSLGCKALTNGVNMYNAFGSLVWSYSWKITWCYDGSKITSLTPQRIVNIYDAGYSFQGDITSNTSGGVNQWSDYQYKQGDMCYIDYGINCAWHTYPSVEQTVYGNDTSSGSAWYNQK